MSSFTTQVRFICEQAAGETESKGGDSVTSIINRASPRIFNFTYPIFDEEYRNELNHKILRHFYTREIGYETVGLWKLKLEDKLNLIMPYYNRLYESTLINFNPLFDVDYTTEGNKKKDKNTVSAGTTEETANRNITGSTNENTDKTNISNKDITESETNNKTENVTKENNITEINSNDFMGTDAGTNNRTRANSKTATNMESRDESGNLSKNSWDLYSDTPQSGVYGLNNFDTPNSGGGSSVSNNSYLTNARRLTDDENDSRRRDSNGLSIEDGNDSENGSSNVAYNYNTEVTGLTSNDGKENSTETVSKSKGGSVSDNEFGNVSKTGSENRNIGDNRNGNTTNIGNENGTEDYVQRIYGKKGNYSYSKMIDEFRKTFINVDMMIMKELEPLFMGLWEV